MENANAEDIPAGQEQAEEQAPPQDPVSRGAECLRQGDRLRALSFFEKARKAGDSPEARSYIGLLTATDRGQLGRGMELCTSALEEAPENPVLYLNLGKVLLKAGDKKKAIETARKGLHYGYNKDIEDWLQTMGIRKRPLFPFLARDNVLNKYLGFILSRLGLR
jgi:tetratricopeptide (TPR) repeat protein